MTETSGSPLRGLLRNVGFRRWTVANLFARVPLTMNLLALVLVGERVSGSLATGATLAGILTVTSGLLAQPRGRLLDRRELRGGLQRDLLVSAAGMLAIAGAATIGAPLWVLGVLAAGEGVASAALLGGFRALLVPTVPADEIEPANALDAVFVEVAFIAGPAVAGAAALVVGPIGVVLLQAGSFVVAAGLLTGLPQRVPMGDLALAGPAPLRTRGAVSVYLLAFGPGLALGAWEATIPARLSGFGWEPAAAGPLLALAALGSGIAGLVAANLRDPLRYGRAMAAALLLAFALAFIPTALAPSALVLGAALFVVGVPIAPLNALAGLALQRIIVEPRQAEGFALYTAMILIGAGTGQALAGVGLRLLSPTTFIAAVATVPAMLGVVVLSAIARRRARGIGTGVGYPHDPTVVDPTSYAVGGSASA